jgi:N-acylneuraminate cytidylyltransferase/CMP-N,N'-diacetyllegionaminic acid synthase
MKQTNLKVMGIIGIRSGSKGVPNKNIKLLAGKPLIGWILDTAKKSKYMHRLIVSTDSQEYADIATSLGADVPCLRPKKFATDNSPEFEYVKHMIEWLQENENYKPDIVVRMMATTPMQTIEDIDACIEKLINDDKVDSTVVIAEARQHPLKALKIINDNKEKRKLVTYFSESGREVTPIARQTHDKAYFRANAIAFRTRVVFDTNSLTGDLVHFQITSQENAIDIDSNIDFSFVEYLMKEQ